MPVLSVYIGSSCVNALLYVDDSEYSFLSFPFAYSDALFSNYVSVDEFYKGVLDYFCKQEKAKLSDCDIVLTTDTPHNLSKIGAKMVLGLGEVFTSMSHYFPLMIDSCSIITPRDSLSYVDLKRANIINSDEVEDVEMDYYANLALYPQVVPPDMPARMEIDKAISAKTYAYPLTFNSESPLVFTGPRFMRHFSSGEHEELDYMLMLSLLNSAGIYDIYVDRDMSAILLAMLRTYLNSETTAHDTVKKVGVVIDSNGPIECLVTSEIGTSQLVEIEKNRIFIVPLGEREKAKILVKSSSFGTVEKYVEGGKLGLIFDTREIKADLTSDIKVFDYSMHLFSQALKKI